MPMIIRKMEYTRISNLAFALGENRRLILTHLAERGPLTRYFFKKELGFSYSHTHSDFKWFEKNKLIKIYKKEIFKKTGLLMPYYGVTLLGLHVLFYYMNVRGLPKTIMVKTLDMAMQKYPPIFIIFKKWRYYENQDKTIREFGWRLDTSKSMVYLAKQALIDVLSKDRTVQNEEALSQELMTEFLIHRIMWHVHTPLEPRDLIVETSGPESRRRTEILSTISDTTASWMWVATKIVGKQGRLNLIEQIKRKAVYHNAASNILISFIRYLKNPVDPIRIDLEKWESHYNSIFYKWEIPDELKC